MIESSPGVQYFRQKDNLPAGLQRKDTFTATEVRTAWEESDVLFTQTTKEILANHSLDGILTRWQADAGASYYTDVITPDERKTLATLPSEEKKLLSDYFVYAAGKRRAELNPHKNNQKKDWFTQIFRRKNGTEGSVKMQVPINGVLDYLSRKIDLIRTSGPLSEADSQQVHTLLKTGRTLLKHSVPLGTQWRVANEENAIPGTNAFDLANAEAQYIAQDPLRATNSPTKDFIAGVNTMKQRRGLKIPGEVAQRVQELQQEEQDPPGAKDTSQPPESENKVQTDELLPVPLRSQEKGATQPPPVPPAPIAEESPSIVKDPQPSTIEELKERFGVTMGFVTRDKDIKAQAKIGAIEAVQEQLHAGKKWSLKDWANRTKHRLLQTFYVEKGTEILQREMYKNHNSYLTMDVLKNSAVKADARIADYKASGQAKVEQVKAGIELQGEKVKKMQDSVLKKDFIDRIVVAIVDNRTTDLMGSGGRHITTADDLHTALGAFIVQHRNDQEIKDVFGDKDHREFANDIWDASNKLKTHYERQEITLEQLNDLVDISMGNTTWAAQTELQLSWVDKIVQKAERHGLFKEGKFPLTINPATLGAGLALCELPARILARREVAQAAAVVLPGAGLIAGSTFAALRRYSELNRDRMMHKIQMASGGELPADAPRRKQMESFTYDVASAKELLDGGGTELLTKNARQRLDVLLAQDLSATQTENRKAVMRRITEIQARLDSSILKKEDFIRYDGKTQMEQGRWELMKAVIAAKKTLRDKGGEGDFGQLQLLKKDWETAFSKNKTDQDKAFARHRLLHAGGAGMVGAAAGVATGLGAQEIVAVAARGASELTEQLSPSMSQFFDRLSGETLAEKGVKNAWKAITGSELGSSAPTVAGVDLQQFYDHPGSTTLPNGMHLTIDAEHAVTLSDAHGSVLPESTHITIDNAGQLHAVGTISPALEKELHNAGFDVQRGKDMLVELLQKDMPLKDAPDTTIPGITTRIPQGTHWESAGPDKWNLVINGHSHDHILLQNARVVDGKLTADWAHSELQPGDLPDPQVENVAGNYDERKTFWETKGTKITKEWYGYNQPGSQENELRQFNTVYGEQGDGVRAYINHPGDSVQEGLDPSRLNVPQAIKEGKLAFLISIPGTDEHIIVHDGDDGLIDGGVNFDPHDETHVITLGDGSKMTIGQFTRERLVDSSIFKGEIPTGKGLATEWRGGKFLNTFMLGGPNGESGHIEGAIAWQQDDGSTVYKVINTIRGQGAPGEFSHTTIDIPSKLIEHAIPRYDITPLPPPEDNESPPFIPIPFAPRWALEPLSKEPRRNGQLREQPHRPNPLTEREREGNRNGKLRDLTFGSHKDARTETLTPALDYLQQRPDRIRAQVNVYQDPVDGAKYYLQKSWRFPYDAFPDEQKDAPQTVADVPDYSTVLHAVYKDGKKRPKNEVPDSSLVVQSEPEEIKGVNETLQRAGKDAQGKEQMAATAVDTFLAMNDADRTLRFSGKVFRDEITFGDGNGATIIMQREPSGKWILQHESPHSRGQTVIPEGSMDRTLILSKMYESLRPPAQRTDAGKEAFIKNYSARLGELLMTYYLSESSLAAEPVMEEDQAPVAPVAPKAESEAETLKTVSIQVAVEKANPQHAATSEDAHGHEVITKDGQHIDRWIVVDGSGGSIPDTDAERSKKVRDVAVLMASAIKDTSLATPKDVLIKADEMGRTMEGYGTVVAVDFNPQTGEAQIAHRGDAAALRWRKTPYDAKRLYEPNEKKSGQIQLLTEQENLSERLRQRGMATTQDLEGRASAQIYANIGDTTVPVETVAQGIHETTVTLEDNEWLMLVSDGARVGDMLSDNDALQVQVNETMEALDTGAITPEEAAFLLTEHMNLRAGPDTDDITVVLLAKNRALPPVSEVSDTTLPEEGDEKLEMEKQAETVRRNIENISKKKHALMPPLFPELTLRLNNNQQPVIIESTTADPSIDLALYFTREYDRVTREHAATGIPGTASEPIYIATMNDDNSRATLWQITPGSLDPKDLIDNMQQLPDGTRYYHPGTISLTDVYEVDISTEEERPPRSIQGKLNMDRVRDVLTQSNEFKRMYSLSLVQP